MPLDIGIDKDGALEQLGQGTCLLSYLNPFAWSVTKEFSGYVSDLERFDLVVCDGVGVQAAVEAVFTRTTPVISLDYSGIGREYLNLGSGAKMSLCMVGSEYEIVRDAARIIEEDYPGFTEVAFFSGYGDSLKDARDFILRARPDLVLVGLGMARQEAYLLDLVDAGWSGIGICVGGFFDKLAKPGLDYPEWIAKRKLRFLWRLIREPRRLSRRYFIDYQPFIKLYLKHVLRRVRGT
jgi:N-acetylglucosaminyldiphosphoundecaprenol N-acetyl-beta-D-mannosaminyltransferase